MTAKEVEYSPEFEAAWAIYPSRGQSNSNPKRGAWLQWQKRVKEGVDAGYMLTQTARFKLRMQESRKIGTQYVMMAQTFYGPGRPFESDWGTEEENTPTTEGPAWNRQWGKEKPPTEPTMTQRWEIRKKK